MEPRQQAEPRRRVVQGLRNVLRLGVGILRLVVPIGITIKKKKTTHRRSARGTTRATAAISNPARETATAMAKTVSRTAASARDTTAGNAASRTATAIGEPHTAHGEPLPAVAPPISNKPKKKKKHKK